MPVDAISSTKKSPVMCSHAIVKMRFAAREKIRGISVVGRSLFTAVASQCWRRMPTTCRRKKTGARQTLV